MLSSSQCWCARFGELTAINNIVRTSRRARSKKKKQCWVEVSQLFLTETVGMMLVRVLFWACLDGIGFRLAEQNKRQLSWSKRLTSKCPPSSKICSLLVFVTFTTISLAPRTSYMYPNQVLGIQRLSFEVDCHPNYVSR